MAAIHYHLLSPPANSNNMRHAPPSSNRHKERQRVEAEPQRRKRRLRTPAEMHRGGGKMANGKCGSMKMATAHHTWTHAVAVYVAVGVRKPHATFVFIFFFCSLFFCPICSCLSALCRVLRCALVQMLHSQVDYYVKIFSLHLFQFVATCSS